MKAQFVAVAAFAGSAFASLEGYGSAESTTSPVAPGYGASSSSSTPVAVPSSTSECTEEIESTTSIPAYPVTTSVSSVIIPAYPTTTSPVESALESTTCTEETASTESATVPAYSSPSSSVPVPVESTTTVPVVPGYSKSSSVPVGTGFSSVPVVPGYSKSVSSPVGSVTPSTIAPVVSISSSCASASTWYETSVITKTAPGTCTTIPVTGLLTAPAPSGTIPTKPYGYGNSTVPASGTGSTPSSTFPATYTGAASKMAGGAVVGMVGVIGAFFL